MADLFDDMSDENASGDLLDILASDKEDEVGDGRPARPMVHQPGESEKKAKKDKGKGDKKEVPVRAAKDNSKKPQSSGGDKKPQGALAYTLQDQCGNEVVGHSFSQVQLLKLQGLITHHCETLVCDLCGERAVILSMARLTLVVCEQQSQQSAGQGQASATAQAGSAGLESGSAPAPRNEILSFFLDSRFYILLCIIYSSIFFYIR